MKHFPGSSYRTFLLYPAFPPPVIFPWIGVSTRSSLLVDVKLKWRLWLKVGITDYGMYEIGYSVHKPATK